jgi:drug/metabolite transporter (DMT)-like permease
MFSLFLAILSSSSIAWLFKITEGGNYNRYRVTTANYGVAFFVSLTLFLTNVIKEGSDFNVYQIHWGSVLGVGIPAGLFFFLSLVFYQKSVKENGASLSGMFGKLGILLPMMIAIVIWKEIPTLIQSVGICLAIAAMVYVNYSPGQGGLKHTKVSLILLFFAGGMAEFSNKMFQKMGQTSDKNLFLFVVFFVAFCLSLFKSYNVIDAEGTSAKKDYLIGGIVGIPNLLSSVFLISALGSIPATVAFPIYSSGAIALITLGSFLFFREEIGKKAWVALGFTMVAMILVNI